MQGNFSTVISIRSGFGATSVRSLANHGEEYCERLRRERPREA